MAASNERSNCDAFLTLANLTTIYILHGLSHDTVTSDDEFRRYIQSRDRYWHTSDQLSESLLKAEADLMDSLPDPISKIVNDAVPQHHQDVADDFVSAFRRAVATTGAPRSPWLDFAVFAGCLTHFLQLFDTDYLSRERLPVTRLREELSSIVNDTARRFHLAQRDDTIELLQCQAKWRQYVAAGIQRFHTATE